MSSGKSRQVRVRSIASFLSAVLAFNVAPSISFAQVAERRAPTTDAAALEQQLTYYYRAPSNVLDMLKQWERLPQSRSYRVTMIGFLAGVFAKDPSASDPIVKAKLEAHTQVVVWMGLTMADRRIEANNAAIAWGWSSEQIAGLPKLEPLLQLKRVQPAIFDTLWAASFATGDARYVRPIYLYYDMLLAQAEINEADVIAAVIARHLRDTSALAQLSKKYPKEIFTKIAAGAAALWSLESNSRQHAFVAAALAGYAKQNPNSAAIRGVNAVKSARALTSPR